MHKCHFVIVTEYRLKIKGKTHQRQPSVYHSMTYSGGGGGGGVSTDRTALLKVFLHTLILAGHFFHINVFLKTKQKTRKKEPAT